MSASPLPSFLSTSPCEPDIISSYRYEVNDDGTLDNRETFAFTTPGNADGMRPFFRPSDLTAIRHSLRLQWQRLRRLRRRYSGLGSKREIDREDLPRRDERELPGEPRHVDWTRLMSLTVCRDRADGDLRRDPTLLCRARGSRCKPRFLKQIMRLNQARRAILINNLRFPLIASLPLVLRLLILILIDDIVIDRILVLLNIAIGDRFVLYI